MNAIIYWIDLSKKNKKTWLRARRTIVKEMKIIEGFAENRL